MGREKAGSAEDHDHCVDDDNGVNDNHDGDDDHVDDDNGRRGERRRVRLMIVLFMMIVRGVDLGAGHGG